ncbi:MAG: NAD regulator [Hyphomicrobiaceae bacterium]
MIDEIRVGLTAVVLSVHQEQPVVLTTPNDRHASGVIPAEATAVARLPTGRFSPKGQASLESELRNVVLRSAGLELGYIEQLLTDYCLASDPAGGDAGGGQRQLSVSYMALTRADTTPLAPGAKWLDCYELLPWEDFRGGRPTVLANQIVPALQRWAAGADEGIATSEGEAPMSRSERIAVSFGLSGRTWDDQRVVDRFDLLLEAGFVQQLAPPPLDPSDMRVVAAGLGRLRAKTRYRPVVFELLPFEFTLFELQRAVEAVLGPTLHKQNFRRLVEGTGLVEPTGEVRNNTGGRPAKTYRFRREVLLERPAPGVHVRAGRAA